MSYEREVRKICGTNMRSDFVLTHENKRRTVMEVKTVNTDFESRKEGGPKIQFVSKRPVRRIAIFLGEDLVRRVRMVKSCLGACYQTCGRVGTYTDW